MPDLAGIRARLAEANIQVNQYKRESRFDLPPYWLAVYKSDVDALLAALDGKAQKEADRG